MPFYRFSSSSTAPDDGYNVLAPNVGTGRWLLLRYEAAVPTTAQLAAVPPTQRSEGVALYVNSANSWYQFEAGTPSIGDITPTQGTGRWVQVTTPTQVIAPFQRTYNHVDAMALDDSHFVFYPSVTIYNHRDAIALADKFTYSVVSPALHRDAVALADDVAYSVVPPALHRDAIAIADKSTYSVLGEAFYDHKDAIAVADSHQFLSAIDFGSIVVDNLGNVVASNGLVVSTDGNPGFDKIVVDTQGNVVVSNGLVVSTDGSADFDKIVVDTQGDVVVSNGTVISQP